jgi:hypothetical protein
MPGPVRSPKVIDASGAEISFQGVQKVRNYAMPFQRVRLLDTTGHNFATEYEEGMPRAIIGDQKGTATIYDAEGNQIIGFPITGVEQYIMISGISTLSTTTKVWGLW